MCCTTAPQPSQAPFSAASQRALAAQIHRLWLARCLLGRDRGAKLTLFPLCKGINERAQGQNLWLPRLNKGTKSSANQTLLNLMVSGHWSKTWGNILYFQQSSLHYVAMSPVLTGINDLSAWQSGLGSQPAPSGKRQSVGWDLLLTTLLLLLSAGSAYYDNVRPLAYPDSDAVLICFDISRPETLDSVLKKVSALQLARWVPAAARGAAPGSPLPEAVTRA